MMRNIKSRKWLGEKSRSRNSEPEPPPQEITPSSGWAEDSNCHYLLLELSDFKQVEEIKMQIEGSEHIKISGERKASGAKTIYFDKTYTVPDNSDLEKTSLKLELGVFTVTIPKQLPPSVQEIASAEIKSTDKNFDAVVKKEGDHGEDGKLKDQEQPQPDYGGDLRKETNGEEHQEKNEKSAEEEEHRDFSRDTNRFNGAAKMICKSKNTIFMTLIAFCLGVLVSRKIGHY